MDASRITFSYLCENRFKIQNSNPMALLVDWKVQNTGDQGELTVPAPPASQSFSETVFETHAIGTVVLTSGGVNVGQAVNTQTDCSTLNGSQVQVAVSPQSANVVKSATQQFSAQVTGDPDTTVIWSVQEGPSGGSVSAQGLYTAPATTGTYHVVATAHADQSKSAVATVNVAGIQVTISPKNASVGLSGSQQFSASVAGNTDTAVLWSVQEGSSGGTVDASGLYRAPGSAGTFHVVAKSHADPSRGDVATVTASAMQVVANPSSVTVAALFTQQLSATVSGSADTGVIWSVQEGTAGGGVDPTGLYAAPGEGGTFHVIAAAHANPGVFAVVTVTVTPPGQTPVSMDLNPTSATVAPGGSVQLFGQVLYSSDQGISWSVQEGSAGGSVDQSGNYTAPAAAGTYHVTAVAHVDSTVHRTATITVTPGGAGSTGPGQWGPVEPWPLVPIEVVLLKNGNVLAWSRLEQPHLWNPQTNTFTEVASPSWEFCAGLTIMSDGRVIVPGGHINDNYGLPDVNIFDPSSNTWSSQPKMAAGRWYPTVIETGDNQIVVVAGNTADATGNLIPEVRNADGSWRELTGASLEVPFYPSLFNAPNGQIFMAGSDRHSKYLDISGAGQWIQGPTMHSGQRDYGVAVMYAPGKILLAGGGDPPVNTAEIVDLNQPSPVWNFTGSMHHARRQVTGTVLPDGKVLVTGGTSAAGFDNESGAIFSAELWDPNSGVFTELASEKVIRVYHAVALLMPDARVLVGGGGQGANGTDEPNIEMFSPPYLFNGDGSPAARPSISSAPDQIGYGQTFTVNTPDAASVATVALVRNGAVTHTYNTSQLRVTAPFTAGGGSLSVTMPSDRTAAPPGYYMLFLLNAQGVPSVAKIVHIG